MTGSSSGRNFPDNFSKLRNEKDGRTSLSEKSKIELVDLLYREEKLCKNTKFLEKLPDKGVKILKFYEEVKVELHKRDSQETLCEKLAKLTVDENRSALDRLEWTGDYRTDSKDSSVNEDDTNLFRILATHSSTEASRSKNIKFETPTVAQPPADDDLPKVDPYAQELCYRFDSNAVSSTKKKFYAHKPLHRISMKDNVKDETIRDSTVSLSNAHTEDLASKVKVLSLQESINVQHQQNKTLKELEFRSAIEKLRSKISIESRSPQSIGLDYREHSDVDSEDDTCSTLSREEFAPEDE